MNIHTPRPPAHNAPRNTSPRILVVSWLPWHDFGGSELFWTQFIRRAPEDWEFGVFYISPTRAIPTLDTLETQGTTFYWQRRSRALQALATRGGFWQQVIATDRPNSLRGRAHRLLAWFFHYVPDGFFVRGLCKAIDRFQPDLIWINLGQHMPYHYMLKTPWPKGVPRITMVQALLTPLLNLGVHVEAAASFFARSDLVTFPTTRNRRDLERILCEPIDNGVVVGNFVDCTRFRSANRQTPRDRWRIACVGRLEIQSKGQDILLDALASPRLIGLPWELKLIGTGWNEKYLRRLSDHYGIADRVQTGGSDDVAGELTKTDLFVLPSNWEGQSFALLEAMASGLPCVVSDVAGQADLVRDAGCGWSFGAGSPGALQEALTSAWEQRHNSEVGENGRRFVEQHHDLPVVMERMRAHMRDVLVKNGRIPA